MPRTGQSKGRKNTDAEKSIRGRHEPSHESVDRFEQELGNALNVARGKRSFNQLGDITGIDRRILSRLADKKKLGAITAHQLLALNSLLGGKLVESLRNVQGSTLAATLAETRGLFFILGARDLERTDHVSRWDVRAITSVVRGVQRHSAQPQAIHVEDVFRIRPAQRQDGSYDFSTYDSAFQKEPWFGMLDQYDGRAVVVLGSPVTCHPCEHVLARMFDTKPYGEGNVTLPFRFLWSNELRARVPSTFAACAHEVGLKAISPSRNGIVGLQIGTKILPIVETQPEWDTYGVCVAQRRQGGQLWLVVAGATGTATFATAELLDEVKTILPTKAPQHHSPPIWFAVAAKVRREGGRKGDDRVVASQRIIAGPDEWDLGNKRN